MRDTLDRDELDDFVRVFEVEYQRRGQADPAEFLPPPGHPLFAAVLCELVRVDLEFGWERGRPKTLTDYQRAFPALWDDPDGLSAIALEEFRLRWQAGEDPSPWEYLERYGVRVEDRPGRWRSADDFGEALTTVAGSDEGRGLEGDRPGGP